MEEKALLMSEVRTGRLVRKHRVARVTEMVTAKVSEIASLNVRNVQANSAGL